jgi:hypothetical protein
MRVIAIIGHVLGFVLGLALSAAAAQACDPLPLVKSFYAKTFDDETMPLAPRL